jgi:acetyl esterase/lipase
VKLSPLFDQSYGQDPCHKFDLYPSAGSTPEAPAKTVIIFFHGGSWRRGDKHSYGFIGRRLAAMGYTAAIPNYRLYPAVTFPAYIEDAAAVTQHIAHTQHPQQLILMGHSAGGHIAAVLALDAARYFEALPSPAPRIAGFIGLAGAYNPKVWRRNAAFGTADPALWNPLDLVTSSAPPMLLLHGRLDTTVPPNQTLALAQAVTAVHGRADVHLYALMEHFSALLPLVPGFGLYTSIRRDIRRFIESL